MLRCPTCGEENPDRFRLCGFCGAALQPEAPAEDKRRIVTVVFSDLKGSTSLGERLDSEALREVLAIYFEAMSAVLVRHGGTIEKYIGDAIMAVFGLPRLHEDDAVRAVRAAAEMRATLEVVNERLQADYGVKLENRTGVYTGEVVAGDVTTGQRLVTGDTVNVAARLEQAAPASEVLIGQPTYELVRDAVEVEPVEPLELKGKAERVPAYQLLHAGPGEGRVRRVDLPLVGRAEQIMALSGVLDVVRDTGRPQLVTLVAPAGTGKSRLVKGFLDGRGRELSSLVGRCLPYGEGITYWPIAEAVRGLARVLQDDPVEVVAERVGELFAKIPDAGRRVASVIGLSDDAFPAEEIAWGVRRLLETQASEDPVIMVLDDIHWAEPTLLDLAKELVDTVEAPLLLLCAARRDLLDDHPDWPTEGPRVRTIDLSPLTDEESNLVVGSLLGTGAVDPPVATWLTTAAEGNPLFLEQLLSMLIDDEVVRQEDGRWVAVKPLDEVEVPGTITSLLAARLDRLGPTDRTVIERGSVMGQLFYRGGVEALSPDAVRPLVAGSLDSLEAKELVRSTGDVFAALPVYRFQHVLVRDVAYEGMLKRTRAELHAALVDWFESVAPDRLREFEEIRGYHLEQAFLIFVELGTGDERAAGIGRRGAEHLSSAGRRALARGDMPAASNLLQRAVALLPTGDAQRPRLMLDAGDASIEVGDFALADDLLRRAEEEATASADRALEITARLAHLRLRYTMEPEAIEPLIADEVALVVPQLEELGSHEGLARAWRLLTQVNFTACRWGAVEEAAIRMTEHAQLAGDPASAARFLGAQAMAALYGPTPVPEAEERCEALQGRVGDDRRTHAIVLGVQAHLAAMRGRFEEAREHYGSSRETLDELGLRFHAALVSFDSGAVEMLADDPVAAERELRMDYEVLSGLGDKDYMPTTAALLAGALYEQGRFDEADGFARISEDAAAPDDITSQWMWRSVRSKLLAQRNETLAAETLIHEAVELIERTEEPESQATVLMDLAEVLALAGREEDAIPHVREALIRFEMKGNIVSAARAFERLSTLAGGSVGLPAAQRTNV